MGPFPDESPNAEIDADDSEENVEAGETSPDELRERRYPIVPELKISEAKIRRLIVRRVLNGKEQTITTVAHPVATTWEHIFAICGGGDFVVRPVDSFNRLLGSKTESRAGRPRHLSEIQWPDELTVPDSPTKAFAASTAVEKAAPEGDAAAVEKAAAIKRMEFDWQDERDRRSREWEAKIERERQAFEARLAQERAEREDERARRAAIDAAEQKRRDQEHELRMAQMTAQLTASQKGNESALSVELKKLEVNSAMDLKRLEIESKQKHADDLASKLFGFGERLVTKVVEEKPEVAAKIAGAVFGDAARDSARTLVSEQAKEVMPAIAGDAAVIVAEKALERLTPDQVIGHFARAVASRPDLAAQLAAALKGE